jgi:hypothetical protein
MKKSFFLIPALCFGVMRRQAAGVAIELQLPMKSRIVTTHNNPAACVRVARRLVESDALCSRLVVSHKYES